MADGIKIGTLPRLPQIEKAPRIGELRTRGTLLKFTETQTASGGKGPGNYESVGEVWAKVQILTGARLFYTQQVSEKAAVWVTLRYRPDVLQGWRFATQDGRHTYEIVLPPNDPEYRHQQLICTCRELQSDET